MKSRTFSASGNQRPSAERAKEVVASGTHTLTERDWRLFLSGLEKPKRRRPRLEAAAKRYLGRRPRGKR